MKRITQVLLGVLMLASLAVGQTTVTGTGPTTFTQDGKGNWSLTYTPVVIPPPPPPVVSISITPTSSTLTSGATQQFSTTVTGSSNLAVNWGVSGTGKISATGLYTSASGLTSTSVDTVIAIAVADSTKSASAQVTVNPATPPPPPPPPPGTGTAVTNCGQALSANTTYYLANDIGSDPTANCLTPAGPSMVFNLNGHKITGTMKASNVLTSGVHIYNGSLSCTDSDAMRPGCLYISSPGAIAITGVLEIDHLNIVNKGTTSSGSERGLMVDMGTGGMSTVVGPNVKVHDNTAVSATGLNSNRIVNLQVQGTAHSTPAYAEFYNNATLCQSTAAACQGIVAYGLSNVKVHNNTLVNQLSNPASSETPRAVICDQTDGCEVWANIIDAQDGRAVRLRGTSAKHDVNSVHDNTINNVVAGTNGNHVAAFHIGDPDSGTEVENATIYNNTINAKDGWVFMARSATGITIRDNTVNGSGTVNLLDERSVGAATSVNLLRTTFSSGTAGSSFCEPGVTSNICKSGAATKCTITTSC